MVGWETKTCTQYPIFLAVGGFTFFRPLSLLLEVLVAVTSLERFVTSLIYPLLNIATPFKGCARPK